MPDTPADAPLCPPSYSAAERAAADASIADLLSLLGRRHTLALLYLFTREPAGWRFGDLQRELSLSPTTLSERLSDLVAAELLDRTVYDEHPPRVEYAPTERLLGMKPVFGALYRWAGEFGPA